MTLQVVAMCAEYGAPCVVDDRLDVALTGGAGGVHLGAQDPSVDAPRALAGPGFIRGATVRDPAGAIAAMAAGASYLGVGPAFATATKVGLPSPIGPVTVAAVVEGGVHGLALVDAVHGADDPASAVRELRIELGAPALS